MQEGRLFRIVYYLLDKGRATAPELAKHFEVSVRTIYRDIDILSGAGIPIYAETGRNGGIYLMKGVVLDKTVLSDEEKQEILLAMAFDFKKEYKEFYMPKSKPEIVIVPTANYIAVRGQGNPNEDGGDYQKAIAVLYAVAYTLKMSYKTEHKIEGFYEYVVPPLEGFWWQNSCHSIDYANKDTFNWISVIRLPDFVTKKDFDWAVDTATKKKKLDCSSAEFLIIEEGLCVQIMHIGSFDNEPATVAIMDKFLNENGYSNDISDTRLHHEIYMSDARKVVPEKWKTVIRHPIRKIND